MFIAHALLKYFVFTLPGTVQYFESIGLPGALAYATIAAELVVLPTPPEPAHTQTRLSASSSATFT